MITAVMRKKSTSDGSTDNMLRDIQTITHTKKNTRAKYNVIYS